MVKYFSFFAKYLTPGASKKNACSKKIFMKVQTFDRVCLSDLNSTTSIKIHQICLKFKKVDILPDVFI